MSKLYTEDQVRDMIMNYHEGTDRQKKEFLEHAGISSPNHEVRLIVTVSANDIQTSSERIHLRALIEEGMKSSNHKNWVKASDYTLVRVERA